MNLTKAQYEDERAKFEQLIYAKEAVQYCLKSKTCLVDMHGLTYWAERVEKLRNEIEL